MSTKQPEDGPATDPTVANRFLAHQLSDAERVLLEAQLLVNPDAVKELEATARFKVGLHKLRETGQLDELLRSPPPRSYRTFAFAAAACVIIGIAIMVGRLYGSATPMLVTSADQLKPRAGRVLPVTVPYALIRIRAAAERTVIELPPSRQAIQLRLFPSLQAQAPYRVSLAAADGKLLGSTIAPSADEDRFVTVFVDSEQLERGNYLCTVAEASGREGTDESYLIEVRRLPGRQ